MKKRTIIIQQHPRFLRISFQRMTEPAVIRLIGIVLFYLQFRFICRNISEQADAPICIFRFILPYISRFYHIINLYKLLTIRIFTLFLSVTLLSAKEKHIKPLYIQFLPPAVDAESGSLQCTGNNGKLPRQSLCTAVYQDRTLYKPRLPDLCAQKRYILQ